MKRVRDAPRYATRTSVSRFADIALAPEIRTINVERAARLYSRRAHPIRRAPAAEATKLNQLNTRIEIRSLFRIPKKQRKMYLQIIEFSNFTSNRIYN